MDKFVPMYTKIGLTIRHKVMKAYLRFQIILGGLFNINKYIIMYHNITFSPSITVIVTYFEHPAT